MPECRHCPDGHDNPRSKPWGVHVASTRDGDGQPTTLHVAPSNGSHVAESDADWLRSLIKGDAANAAAIIGEVLAPLHARLAAVEFELAEAIRQRRDAEAAIARVRDVHRVHRCAVDGHIHTRTPTPCVNDGVCGCGRRAPCPTIAALDSPEGTP